ncbi:MAG TPA: hypothetical protein PLO55_08780, partial [Thermotogota bacterium]|nr:hypothetical protein [Thermotogota bacterium]
AIVVQAKELMAKTLSKKSNHRTFFTWITPLKICEEHPIIPYLFGKRNYFTSPKYSCCLHK